ncbi:MAG: hypothetical protein F4076_08265 [Acidimicrobiaceae bacterium]|nr:hypothetical protein [Acidimicrobiaceae bacterium]
MAALRKRWRPRLRAQPEPAHFAYSRWDGSQPGFDFDADHIFDELADDLLYHGDLASALRRLMAEGFRDRSGRQLEGLRDMLERLRERRRELLQQHDLGGVCDDIAEDLRDVVRTERRALDDLDAAAAQARAGGDERRADLTAQTAATKNAQLDMMPPDLAGQFKALDNYDFESDEARRQFAELAERLREQLMQQFLDRMAGAVGDATGDGAASEEMQRLKDMLAELNAMLAQRARGEEPDFEGFMERYGDFFPENPKTFDELLEVMARRMAAAQALLNSMTPGQRDQLQQLSDQLLADMDLNWQVNDLAQHLRNEFGDLGWERRYDFDGVDPLDFSQASDMLAELGDIDRLENLLRGSASPGALAEADTEAVRRLLGDAAAESLERMAEVARMLEEAGLIENREGRFDLTPRAIRKIGQGALRDLFTRLDADKFGRHAISRSGLGHEREPDTKPYEYGDPFNLHIGRTIRNAVTRTGGGVPVQLHPDDFEVERTEQQVRSATVLMLDLSLSMPMRNNFLPAKKVAMALHSLISTQYPRDYLGLVSFSEVAREFRPEKLPEVSWDYVYGTNMQHGFMLARRMLNRQTGTKQIIMITDGEPTAHIAASGRPFFSYPPTRETVDLTLAEVGRCTRDGIRINTFMLDATSYLTNFVECITKLNGGRAFFTTNENLGDYVLVDFVAHKRSLVHARR